MGDEFSVIILLFLDCLPTNLVTLLQFLTDCNLDRL